MLRHCFFFNDTATTEIYTLSLHDALPICGKARLRETTSAQTVPQTSRESQALAPCGGTRCSAPARCSPPRSEEHTSELQSRQYLVCRPLLEKKKRKQTSASTITQLISCTN